MVIVGAGEAGARAARALREQGWDGTITLIGEEPHEPYERPPLSKAVMTAPGEPPLARTLGAEKLAEWRIEFLHDTRAAAIDRAARCVVLEDGRTVPYARLLLATGARARRLNVPGAEGALYLRNFTDALALRARLVGGAHLVVIGGGFIGLEIAASAITRGCRVTLVEAAPRILMRGVPEAIAARVAARHRAADVVLHEGKGIAALRDAPGGGHVVMLADGTELSCDGVIVGVGAVPETALASASGLPVENGVRADAMLRTDDAAIFVAGDCCSYPSALYDGRRLRLEAWRNAQTQAEAAARNMLGAEAAYDAVPWFWSDQYELVLQVAGLPDAAAVTVQRDVGDAGLLFFHLAEDGRLVAASAIGAMSVVREVRMAEALIAKRVHPDPAALASPSVRLKSLLAA